jgi:D-alanine-D-alanine ligase
MKRVAVIFGGQSTEHDVSIVTALGSVIRPLELTKLYQIEPIYISKDGTWYCDDRLKDIAVYQSGEIDDILTKLKPISLDFTNGLAIIKSSPFAGRKTYLKIDLVFPAMHGTLGEDGSLMGLLDMANVPYVGCGLRASVLAMDKILSKEVALNHDIPVTKYVATTKFELELKPDEIIKNINTMLKFPLFVKPAHLGSSIGISRVKDNQELTNALEVAAHFDQNILIEEEVANLIEVTLPIIGNEELTPGLLERPLNHEASFFDFETKYMGGSKKGKGSKSGSQGYSEIPAKLPKELTDLALNLGLKVYQTFDLKGIARVDMLIDSKKSKVYFNEINPLPGSLYSHNFNQAGISNVELVKKLVNYAQENYKYLKSLNRTFNSNYLRQR